MFKLFSAVASWLDPILPYAPFLTPVVGIGAAVIAMLAIRAQKSIARKRAAIDFFLKTDLDHNMLTAHADFESALKNPVPRARSDHLLRGKCGLFHSASLRLRLYSPARHPRHGAQDNVRQSRERAA
jgi:hypothetical protein